mmetsp:Transcript_17849/g.51967  ORF Transcript_17849/g.51967 Transcript_17849/m.51967 type:complete len:344 (-) Transcript_17849:2989-4020(-)
MWHRHRHITSVGVLSLEVTGSVETRRAAQVDRRGQGTWSPRGLIYAQSTAPLPACSWPLSTECAGGPVPREALAGFRGRWRHLIPDLLARVVTILGREASDDLPVHVGVELCEGVLLHLEERHLASEAVLLLVPLAPVEVEAEDEDALLRPALDLVLLLLLHLVRGNHVVESPVLLDVLATHLLAVRREEALRIEEAGEPEAVGPVVFHPRIELFVAAEHVDPPEADVWHDELRHLLPALGHAREIERVEGVLELGCHDNGASDGKLEVCKHLAHESEHLLQAVNLLRKADVEGLAHAADGLDARRFLVHVVVRGELGLQVLDDLEHLLLAREPARAAPLLGL